MPKDWYIRRNGKTLGPVPSEKLKLLAAAGNIHASDHVANSLEGPWHPVDRIKGLQPGSSRATAMPSDHSKPPGSSPPPPVMQTSPPPPVQGDSTRGLIPYKNSNALAAYYLGIFGLIPVLGLVMAIVAIGFGVSGLKKWKQNPIIAGSVHAWIGIILGVISVGYHALLILFYLMILLQDRR
ncbi:MAG: hypothetical protein FJ247_13085 [Nitrospira sp.]|nr:hypothetical protein [Nitrospira sp.]